MDYPTARGNGSGSIKRLRVLSRDTCWSGGRRQGRLANVKPAQPRRVAKLVEFADPKADAANA